MPRASLRNLPITFQITKYLSCHLCDDVGAIHLFRENMFYVIVVCNTNLQRSAGCVTPYFNETD